MTVVWVLGAVVFAWAFGGILLQLAIWIVALAIQLLVWTFWAFVSLVSLAWLALTDRPALARCWRDAEPGRRIQPG